MLAAAECEVGVTEDLSADEAGKLAGNFANKAVVVTAKRLRTAGVKEERRQCNNY